MNRIETVAELEQLYAAPLPRAVAKVCTHLTPKYREWIGASRFLVLATVGPGGTDASPRGDAGPIVSIQDEHTLLLPDWRGNNRLDSLRNIVEDGRVSLLFMVPGSDNVVRVNGAAIVTTEQSLLSIFEQEGSHPRSVIAVHIREIYFQCAKALMRSRLWRSGDESAQLPTAGQFMREVEPGFDAASYDAGYDDYAKERMW